MSLKELTQKKESPGEKSWIRLFGWIGVVMFLAGTFESLVTLFWIGKAVVPMDGFRISFAAVGFVFALANGQLGIFANNLGALLVRKIKL